MSPKQPKKEEKQLTVHPREMTVEQRREFFLKAKAEQKDDYKIIKADFKEELVPYGFLALDNGVRLGGVARRGRVIQIHGNEGAGKTTHAYSITGNYQQQTGEPVGIFDFERTGSNSFLISNGVDLSLCEFEQPDSVQDSVKKVLTFMRAGVRFFVFDSIPRMKSKIDIQQIMNGDAFKANYGRHAMTMTQFYDILLPYAAEYDCTFIMVNQTRDRIEEGPDAQQAQKYPQFWNLPYSLPGGRVCRFVPSVMIELKLSKGLKPFQGKEGEDPFLLEPATPDTKDMYIVNQVRCRTLKNKVTGGGFREDHTFLRPGKGVDELISIREGARAYGLIEYVGKKWVIGDKDKPLAVFENKEIAQQNLVGDPAKKIQPDLGLLRSLKPLVSKAIDEDMSSRFNTVLEAGLTSYLNPESAQEDDEIEMKAGQAFIIQED